MSEQKHYHGHRARMRKRVLESGASTLQDYELLEMLLFAASARADTKPLSKKLIQEFGSFSGALSASPEMLGRIEEMGDAGISALLVAKEASKRLLQEDMKERPLLQNWKALLDYCRSQMQHEMNEQFRIFFLDKKHRLIADELQQKGTVDHTPVYPREVVRRALEYGASSIILAHNHPGGDPNPSHADIDMTKKIMQAAAGVGILVHDHVIIAGTKHFSFASKGLI